MVASTPSTRHYPKQRHSLNLHRCGQVSLAISWGEPGRKGRWGQPWAQKQAVLCGLTNVEKGAETGANKLGPSMVRRESVPASYVSRISAKK